MFLQLNTARWQLARLRVIEVLYLAMKYILGQDKYQPNLAQYQSVTYSQFDVLPDLMAIRLVLLALSEIEYEP